MNRKITLETLRNEVNFIKLDIHKARVYMATCRNTGAIGFIITDGENMLKLGDYVDACEDREDVEMERAWPYDESWMLGYFELIISSNGVVVRNGMQVKMLYESICGRHSFPLESPVYIGSADGKYFAFDCLTGSLRLFDTKDELKSWLPKIACYQHEKPRLHWWDWRVVSNGIITRFEHGEPDLDEILAVVDQL